MRNYLDVVLILLVMLVAACSGRYTPPLLTRPFENVSIPPDYSLSSSWASLPGKKDAADTVPDYDNIKDAQSSAAADVFFIHPTSYLRETEISKGWNAHIFDSIINAATDRGAILNQASVFNGGAKVYAPRYRQAFIYAYWTTEKDKAEKAFDIAYADVRHALEYYLQHYNNGRPFIIASHSQGTTHAIRLVQDYIDGRPLSSQLVAAYLIGMDVYQSSFDSLQPCTDENETGCYMSWRTFARDYFPKDYVMPQETPLCTNPLTWRTDSTYASRDLNEGGVLRKFNKVIPRLSDAQVLDGVLRINKPHFTGRMFFNFRNYHIVDYNLFYMNIRKNSENRIAKFLEKNPAAHTAE